MCSLTNVFATAFQSRAPDQLCDPIIPVSICVTLPSFTHFVCGKPTMATGVCEAYTEVAQLPLRGQSLLHCYNLFVVHRFIQE